MINILSVCTLIDDKNEPSAREKLELLQKKK